ncbi:MAG: glycosyltransferase family 4 protein [Cyclobacteriaceae bacterium]|nr:glycosyltransferase family 4 protein [Cyclobacteriaceae bacterium]
MNIFIIPSWYPSAAHPITGIFFREQAKALGVQYPSANIGISLWGQNDERLLLWAAEPANSLRKIRNRKQINPGELYVTERNVVEYFCPAFTWTSKILKGNFPNIIKANLYNLNRFEQCFGKVDIIHAQVGFPAGYIANRLATIHKVPYVITEQMTPFPHLFLRSGNGKLVPKLSIAYAGAAKNIAISRALNESMQAAEIKNRCVIPNLVDDAFFNDIDPKPNRNFTFFCLGRMVSQKGVDILLKAVALMKSSVRLRIGGDGEEILDYKAMAGELGIEDRVEWLGELDRTRALREFQHCDAFVLASRHESMGVVFAEALACGKPVIATRCGGPEEFTNRRNGYVVAPGDICALANAMENMVTNISLFDARQISAWCKRRFGAREVCAQIMKVYEQVIDSYTGK